MTNLDVYPRATCACGSQFSCQVRDDGDFEWLECACGKRVPVAVYGMNPRGKARKSEQPVRSTTPECRQ